MREETSKGNVNDERKTTSRQEDECLLASRQDQIILEENNRKYAEERRQMSAVQATENNEMPTIITEMEVQMGEESQAHMETVTSTTGNDNGNTTIELEQSQAQSVSAPPLPRTAVNESQSHVRTTNGSAERKRSRLGEEGTHSNASASLVKLHEYINAIDFHIENMQKNGAKANTATSRAQLSDSARGVLTETTNLMVKMVNGQEVQLCYQKAEKAMRDRIITLQEENMGLKQQIIEFQTKEVNNTTESKGMPMSYMGAAMKNLSGRINEGRQLPVPQIAESIKHAPSECIVIFKAKKKGEILTKSEQEKFRTDVKETIGSESMHLISAIRPTRYGGHIMIFQSEQQRNKIFEKLKKKERERNISDEQSCMIAPKRKVAKAICKEPPSDVSIEGIKRDMYGRHNPALELIPQIHRVGNVMRTRLGLVFELSSAEMQAIQLQDWRIRCDLGREIKVEEFIPLQQCYACCKFGHNAEECKADIEACRLCGKEGHSGKNCPHKDDKERWRCINCKRMNATKNLKLDEKHGAAQLHKCSIAQQQKAVRKMQLAASGVYTTPIIKGSDKLESSRPINNNYQQISNGGRNTINENKKVELEKNKNNDRRSKSKQRTLPSSSASSFNRSNVTSSSATTNSSTSRSFSASSSSSSSKSRNQENLENPCVQRTIKGTRPPIADGWQTIEKRGRGKKSGDSDRGRNISGQVGVNSVNEMEIEEGEEMMPNQWESHTDDE